MCFNYLQHFMLCALQLRDSSDKAKKFKTSENKDELVILFLNC